MKYKDLDLKKIREDNDLDFAHYTYEKGMCSCCYGPKDLSEEFWKGGVIPDHKNYTYLLFKNADNGGGIVTGDDEIKDYQCVNWKFPIEKLENVCKDLQTQLGDGYVVLKPKDDRYCILICKVGSYDIEEEIKQGHYTTIQND